MGLYMKWKMAFAATALALLSMAGGAVYAHTYDPVPTLAVMLAVAVAIATVGRRAAHVFWLKHVLGFKEGDTEETRSYKATTRGRHLAPKLLQLMRKPSGPRMGRHRTERVVTPSNGGGGHTDHFNSAPGHQPKLCQLSDSIWFQN